MIALRRVPADSCSVRPFNRFRFRFRFRFRLSFFAFDIRIRIIPTHSNLPRTLTHTHTQHRFRHPLSCFNACFARRLFIGTTPKTKDPPRDTKQIDLVLCPLKPSSNSDKHKNQPPAAQPFHACPCPFDTGPCLVDRSLSTAELRIRTFSTELESSSLLISSFD